MVKPASYGNSEGIGTLINSSYTVHSYSLISAARLPHRHTYITATLSSQLGWGGEGGAQFPTPPVVLAKFICIKCKDFVLPVTPLQSPRPDPAS